MPSVSNIAAQTLQRRILDGQYPAGSALPGQRELAESLGMSRASLREAISMLEALGLLRSFPGKGVFVTAGTKPTAADLPAGPNEVPPDAVFQMRFVIEPANASLAARQRSDEGLNALRECMNEMQRALSAGDLVTAADCDLRFHLALAEPSFRATLHWPQLPSNSRRNWPTACACPLPTAAISGSRPTNTTSSSLPSLPATALRPARRCKSICFRPLVGSASSFPNPEFFHLSLRHFSGVLP